MFSHLFSCDTKEKINYVLYNNPTITQDVVGMNTMKNSEMSKLNLSNN